MEALAIVILIIAIGFAVWKFGEVIIHAITSFGELFISFLNGEMSKGGTIVFGAVLFIISFICFGIFFKILSFFKQQNDRYL